MSSFNMSPHVLEAFDITDSGQYEMLEKIEGIVIQRIRTDHGVVFDRFTGGDDAYEFMKAVAGESVLGSSEPLELGATFATDVLHRIVLDDTMLQVVSYTFIRPDAHPLVPVLVEPGEFMVVMTKLGHDGNNHQQVIEVFGGRDRADAVAFAFGTLRTVWNETDDVIGLTLIHPGGNEPYFNNG